MLTKQAQLQDADKIKLVPAPMDAPHVWNGIYMRPNIQNGGQVPATGGLSLSSDIWIAGTGTVPNYTTALATATSYQTDAPSNVTLEMTNNIYVRGYNGAQAANTVSVNLYYAPSALVQHPADWQNNVIPTDVPNLTSSTINNLAPGTVGVAQNTFVWQNVQPPPNGSDHYCLIAQFNNAANSNPFPDVSSQLDLSDLITNNLQWGWHNVNLLTASNLSFSFSTGLNTPASFAPGYYQIVLTPTGYTGWQVGLQCSETDSNNNPIALVPTPITQDNLGIIVPNIYLQPNYNALVTVSLYNPNNVQPSQGAKVATALAAYKTQSQAEFMEAVDRGIVNWHLTKQAAKYGASMPFEVFVSMGAVSGVPA